MAKEMTIRDIERILGYDVKIVKEKEKTVKLRDIKPGELFKFGGVEFILLTHSTMSGYSCCITKDVSKQSFRFDNNANTCVTAADIFYVLNHEMSE